MDLPSLDYFKCSAMALALLFMSPCWSSDSYLDSYFVWFLLWNWRDLRLSFFTPSSHLGLFMYVCFCAKFPFKFVWDWARLLCSFIVWFELFLIFIIFTSINFIRLSNVSITDSRVTWKRSVICKFICKFDDLLAS